MPKQFAPLAAIMGSLIVVISIILAVELVNAVALNDSPEADPPIQNAGFALPTATATAESAPTQETSLPETAQAAPPTEMTAEPTPTIRIFPTLTPAHEPEVVDVDPDTPSGQEAAVEPDSEIAEVTALPVTLHIPRLGIEAPIEYVGRNELGNMDVPDDPWNVAWYQPGTVPGNPGNSVLAGHVDSQAGPAIFWHLSELQLGDEIHVVTDTGESLTFVVQHTAAYPLAEVPVRDIFGSTSETRLNLITCHGTFDAAARDYDQRFVVYTTRVG